MASVRIKFRPSTVRHKEGSLYFQIIHNRVVRQLYTDYKIFPDEWDDKNECVIIQGRRANYLSGIRERFSWDEERLKKVIAHLDLERRCYSVDEVVATYERLKSESSLFSFMHAVIAQMKLLGRERTAETYMATLRSIMAFRQGNDVPVDAITSDLILLYEAWLKGRGVTMNTVSFYMRILRAVYNRAVEKGLATQCHPFRHVYTGVEKTVKRAVPIRVVKALKGLDLSVKPSLAFARDMFLFSFYTRGMSFVDMAFLKKSDLRGGILTYRRRKTGQRLSIRWEKCMEEVVARYPGDATYLLPIITREGDERRQYTNAMHLINCRLKILSDMLSLPRPLTMYVARHSWASAAKAKNVPLSVISEGMGHDSETTTQIYLASLDTSVVDKANKLILSLL